METPPIRTYGYREAVIVAAAVCPHPPLLVPEVASGAAAELDDLRAACDDALRHLAAARPDRIIAIGSGPRPSGAEIGRPETPLSLAIADWLLARSGLSADPQLVPTTAVPPRSRVRSPRTSTS